MKLRVGEPRTKGVNRARERLPFAHLDRAQWQRLLDFAAGATFVLALLYIGMEVYLAHGVDFRGYYAAARVVLAGGDPYDYDQVTRVLLDVTGKMGNNPYYYPPWFCLMMVPLATLPFGPSRLIWIALTLGAYWFGARIALDLLGWAKGGWRRWLAMLSGVYLLVWISVRSGQMGTWVFALTMLSLWAYYAGDGGHRWGKPWLAGAALALLLTKPNVTWLTFPVLWLLYWKRQRRAAWWALAVLAALLLVSTWIVPGWWTHLSEPNFGAGLQYELDGPQQVVAIRLNTVLRDWLGQWGLVGTPYWVVWGLLAAASGLTLWVAWRNEADAIYLAALASALGLLLTPYALQYDYPPLALALFWIYTVFPRKWSFQRWAALAVLAFVFSVPLWEYPVYDGYWILLGITGLLVALYAPRWYRPARGRIRERR